MKPPCSVSDCNEPHWARSYCRKHYKRWRANGTPDLIVIPFEERFWAKVDRRGPDECWPWTGATIKGYGHSHLEIGTQRDNTLDSVARGRANRARKLSDDDVLDVVFLAQEGIPRQEIACMYEISPGYVKDLAGGYSRRSPSGGAA